MLLRVGPFGLNLPLWIAAVAAVFLWLSRRSGAAISRESQWLVGAALLAAAGFAWRDSPILNMLDVLAMAVLFGLAANYARGPSLRQAGLTAYILGTAASYIKGLAAPFQLLGQDIEWKSVPRLRWTGTTRAVLRGLLIALPLLLIFGCLFAAADPIFGQMAGHLFRWKFGELPSHIFLILVLGALAAGFLRTVLVSEPLDLTKVKASPWHLGLVDLSTSLGLLNLLFFAFVVIQFRYLFGGAALVEATTGLTYAQYARQGFFQLVIVTVLVLPVLLVGHWLLPPEDPGMDRAFRLLAGALLVQLVIIMASALLRMWYYVQHFGLTALRFYSTAFMGWLAVLVVWFVLTVLRHRRERFAFGTLISGLAMLALLHAVNPDALIVQTNLARAAAGEQFDAIYNAALSDDAIPALVAGMGQLDQPNCRTVAESLKVQRDLQQNEQSFLTWNYGRSRAAQVLEQQPLTCSR